MSSAAAAATRPRPRPAAIMTGTASLARAARRQFGIATVAASSFQHSAEALGRQEASVFAAAALQMGILPHNILLRWTAAEGFGLVAERAVGPGEAVLHVPECAWRSFSCEHALAAAAADTGRRKVLERAVAAEQRMVADGTSRSAGNLSRSAVWACQLARPVGVSCLTDAEQAYLNFLPRSHELGHVPLLWPESKLELLHGSSVQVCNAPDCMQPPRNYSQRTPLWQG